MLILKNLIQSIFNSPTTQNIFFVFLAIAIYKILSNAYFYVRIRHLNQLHLKWVTDMNPTFPTYKREVISLFKRAGICNISTPTAQAIGFNKIASFNADIFTNFPSTNLDVFNGAVRMFSEAEGVYRQRIFETISPVYWIELVVFAPRNLLLYLGFDENKVLFKACNILLTVIWWCLATILVFYSPQLEQLIIELLGQLNDKLG